MTPFECYDSLLKQALPVSEKYIEDGAARIHELAGKLRDQRIQVMLFGAYNAGKSTVINAMLGAERARVGDIPTTDVVAEYEWQGHGLLDTPGVNAPIEHETISKERLQRADLVLFVMRQEDQDNRDIVTRIFELLEAGRPLFILLNYSDSDIEQLQLVRERLNAVLLAEASKRKISVDALSRVPMVLMSAPAALKARLEGKERLLEHSGYNEFMTCFTEWLRSYDDEKQRLQQAFGLIDRLLLAPVSAAIGRLTQDSGESEAITRQIAHIRREGRVLQVGAANQLRATLTARRTDFAGLFDQAGDQQSVIAGIEGIATEVASGLDDWLSQEIVNTLGTAASTSLHSAPVIAGPSSQAEEGKLMAVIEGAAIEAGKKIPPEAIIAALKFGRSLKIPFLKGRWEKTFAKWAGKAAPALKILVSAYELFAAHREEKKENEKALNYALQRNQWVEDICAQLGSAMNDGISETVSAVVEQIVAPLEERLRTLSSQAGTVERDQIFWSELTEAFKSVRF